MAKTITVFGSSKPEPGSAEYETAYELGRLLAEQKFNVCSGGYYGIMEAISKGATELGAEATGITMSEWEKSANKFLTKEIVCNSIFERVVKLIELGDGFVILKGGTGTLLELAAVWELSNKDAMNYKPVACHSIMWKEIVSIMNRQMESEGRNTELVKPIDTIEDIVRYLLKKV